MDKLKSRKLWVAVLGAAFASFATQLGLSETATLEIVALLSAYVLGQSYVDRSAS